MTQPDELLPDRIWVGNENKDLRFRHDAETEKYLGPATEYIRATPRIDDQVDVEALIIDLVKILNEARCLSKRTVGNYELANRLKGYITAHYNLTRKD